MNAEKLLASATEAMTAGSLDQAERDCRSILAIFPRHYRALILLGDILDRAGRTAEALIVRHHADLATPGYTHNFTARCTARFRTVFGPARPPMETSQDKRRVQIRSLGQDGRFGNQLLQYAFVHLYANRHNLIAEFPDWIGRDIFDAADPFPSEKFPTVDESDVDLFGSLTGRTGCVFADRDVKGYFCNDTRDWASWKTEFRALFKPGQKVQEQLDRALNRLLSNGTTLLAIHLRRGDYGHGRFWIAPSSWYIAWLKSIWAGLDRPVVYIASDSAECRSEFDEFDAWTADRLGVDIPGAEFLVDHHILRHAHFVAISNSTFSFTAAMLNEHASTFFRPDPNLRKLVPFDPWSTPILWDPKVDSSAVAANEKRFIQNHIRPNALIVYWGSFCSPWTNFVRSAFHRLNILEIEENDSASRALRARKIGLVQLLVVENMNVLNRFFETANEIFDHTKIDCVLFHLDTDSRDDVLTKRFRRMNYLVYRLKEDSIEKLLPGKLTLRGSHVAIRRKPTTSPDDRFKRYKHGLRKLRDRARGWVSRNLSGR